MTEIESVKYRIGILQYYLNEVELLPYIRQKFEQELKNKLHEIKNEPK